MGRLSATDLHSVLDVAQEFGAVRDLDALHASLLPQIRRLVAYDSASFNHVAPDAREAIVTVVDPVDSMWDGAEEMFGAYAHQNPLIAAAQVPGNDKVLKFSDLISQRHLHGLDIYDLIYSEIGVEHQIAFTLPAPSARVIGCALNRRRRDFSERDREVLEAVRPFFVQAYEQLAARVRAQATIAGLELATESTADGVILLAGDGHIEFATERAGRWLGELGGRDPRTGLPEPLESWSAAQRYAARAGRGPGEPLELCSSQGALTAEFIADGVDGFDVILLEGTRPRDDRFRALGLTEREIDVLSLLGSGLSNAQMARELAISERTIAKHLQHIYDKLGVGSRTAAVARALRG